MPPKVGSPLVLCSMDLEEIEDVIECAPGKELGVYRYKLNPTQSQAVKLFEMTETLRRLWNRTLRYSEETWDQTGKRPKHGDLKKLFITAGRRQNPYLLFVGTGPCQQTLITLEKAYKKYFKDLKTGVQDPGKPKFKRYGKMKTIGFNAIHQCCNIDLSAKRVYVQHVGQIKFDLYRNLPDGAIVRNISLTRHASVGRIDRRSRYIDQETKEVKEIDLRIPLHRHAHNRYIGKQQNWYVNVLFEMPDAATPAKPADRVIAILPGLTPLLNLSDGREIPAPQFYINAQSGLAERQRRADRRKPEKGEKGSNRYKDARKLLAKYQGKIANARLLWHRTVVAQLCRDYDVIVRPKLRISALLRKPDAEPDPNDPRHWFHNNAAMIAHINKQLSDNAWGMLYAEMDREAKQEGVTVIEVSGVEWTQRCHACCYNRCDATVDPVSAHHCPVCGVQYGVENTLHNLLHCAGY